MPVYLVINFFPSGKFDNIMGPWGIGSQKNFFKKPFCLIFPRIVTTIISVKQ